MKNGEMFERLPMKTLPFIYVLDTSNNMLGTGIDQLNEAMRQTVPLLREISEDFSAEIKVGVLSFNDNAKWITENGFVSLEDFVWDDLAPAGLPKIGKAFEELDEKLSRRTWLEDENGYLRPIIIFIMAGSPADDYEEVLEKVITKNKWFEAAIKIGYMITNHAGQAVLKKICGTDEAVMVIQDYRWIKQYIPNIFLDGPRLSNKVVAEDEWKDELDFEEFTPTVGIWEPFDDTYTK